MPDHLTPTGRAAIPTQSDPETHDAQLYSSLSALVLDPDPDTRRLLAGLMTGCFPGLNLTTRDNTDLSGSYHACIIGLFGPETPARPAGDRRAVPRPVPGLSEEHCIALAALTKRSHPESVVVACTGQLSTAHRKKLHDVGVDMICQHSVIGDLPRAIRAVQRAFEAQLIRAANPRSLVG